MDKKVKELAAMGEILFIFFGKSVIFENEVTAMHK